MTNLSFCWFLGLLIMLMISSSESSQQEEEVISSNPMKSYLDSAEFNFISTLLGFISQGLGRGRWRIYENMPILFNQHLNSKTNHLVKWDLLNPIITRSIRYQDINPQFFIPTPSQNTNTTLNETNTTLNETNTTLNETNTTLIEREEVTTYGYFLTQLGYLFEESLGLTPHSEIRKGVLHAIVNSGLSALDRAINMANKSEEDIKTIGHLSKTVVSIRNLVNSYLDDGCNGLITNIRGSFVVLCLREQKHVFNVSFYTEPNFKGLHQSYELINVNNSNSQSNKCYTFGNFLLNYISSVNAGPGCVMLYSEKKCEGLELIILPGVAFNNDLKKWGFDRVIQSFKACY